MGLTTGLLALIGLMNAGAPAPYAYLDLEKVLDAHPQAQVTADRRQVADDVREVLRQLSEERDLELYLRGDNVFPLTPESDVTEEAIRRLQEQF